MGQEPDQIRHDIEATRGSMEETLDEIGDRVSPRRIAQRRTEGVRNALGGFRERVMGAPDDPYLPYTPTGTSGFRDRVGDIPGQASSASSAVSNAASSAADSVRQAPEGIRSAARGNPLIAGLMAFGGGVLLASFLPTTEGEQRAAATVKDRLEPAKEQALQGAKELTEELKPAAQQALEDTKEAARSAADETKGAARVAGEDVRDQAHGSVQEVKDTASSAAQEVRDTAGSAADDVRDQASPST